MRTAKLRLCILLLLGGLVSHPVCAQPEQMLELGEQPLAVLPFGDKVHVFCNQVDRNFNGEQDEGDSPATWWIVDAVGRTVISELALEWGSIGFPFRPGIDSRSAAIYLPLNGKVRSYSLEDQSLIEESVAALDAVAVSVDEHNDRLLLSVRGETDSVVMIGIENDYYGSIAAGTNVQQTLAYKTEMGVQGFVILNEGSFGQSDAQLQIIRDGAEPVVLEIGGTGNHLAYDGDSKLLVCMNGSHEVHIVDLNEEKIVRSIAVGTEGFNGPREALLVEGELFVSTYSDDIRRIDFATGDMLAILNSGGRPEGLALVKGKLWVANAYQTASYDPDNTVAILPPHMSGAVERLVPVGRQPLGIYPVDGKVHVFCGQVDLDFDGVQDEGDLPPAWYVLDALTYRETGRHEFEWGGLGFPFRPGIDAQHKRIYVSHLGRIRCFGLEDQSLLVDTVWEGTAQAVSVSPDGSRLALSIRSLEGGSIVLFDIASRLTAEWPAKTNVQQSIWFSTESVENGLAVLNEGGFGTNDSELQILRLQEGGGVHETLIHLGDTGNHLFQDGELLYVAMNGDHVVHVVDVNEERIVRSIPTHTSGFNGPRESLIYGGDLYVTTYADNIVRIDPANNQLVETLESGGKPEGMALVNGKLWVANAYEFGGYGYEHTVAVIGLPVISSVAPEQAEILDMQVFPNPATDVARLRVRVAHGLSDRCSVDLVHCASAATTFLTETRFAEGEIVVEIPVRALGLAAGHYRLRVRGENFQQSIPLILLR